jgi:hypothetical protein
MLGVKQKQSKLEELLIRVRRNRSRVAGTSLLGSGAFAPEVDLEPETESEETEEEIAYQTPTSPVVDEVTIGGPESLPSTEEEAALEPISPIEELPYIEPETISEELPTVKPEPISAGEELPYIEPETIGEELPTVEPEPISAVEELPYSEPEPAVEEQVTLAPKSVYTIDKPEPLHQFKASPVASDAIAVVTGEPSKEWTLEAVLERAWKLGLHE